MPSTGSGPSLRCASSLNVLIAVIVLAGARLRFGEAEARHLAVEAVAALA